MDRPAPRQWLASAAALVFVAALQVHRLDDSDTWWHLASGRLIAQTGTIARTDPFSYTVPGAPWMNRQWLFELAAYGTWRLAGPAGPALGAGLVFVAGFAALLALARRRLPDWAAGTLVALVAVVSAERFTVRPEAVTICLLALYLLLLDRALTWRRAALLVALQVAWANSHALSVLGLVPIGASLGAAVAARWLPLPRPWREANAGEAAGLAPLAVAFAGGALAETATPWGLEGARYPLVLLGFISGEHVLSHTIIEHRATRLAELTPTVAAGLVVLAALAALAVLVSWRRLRLGPLVVALAFGVAAVLARRNVALFAIGAVPLVAAGFGPVLAPLGGWLVRRGRVLALVPGAIAALVLVVETGRIVRGDWYESASLTRTFGLGTSLLLFPERAVDFLGRAAPDARVFNDDLLGGLLEWEAYPRRRVFIDGRLQVYPPAVYAEWQRVLDDPREFPAVAQRWNLGAVLLHHPSPGRLEMARAIARMPGWRVAYLDAGAVVLLHDGRPAGVPEGVTGPAPAADTPGLAGIVERIVRPLRRPYEESTTYYQRGRAIYSLFGAAGFPMARADFERALRLWPGNALARIGLEATASAAGGVER